MPIFYTQPDQRKTKFSKLWGYAMIACGVLLFSGLFFYELDQIHKLLYIVFGLNLLFSGIDKIKGKQKRFIYIDDEKVECLVYAKGSSIATVEWNDMRWIKKENVGGITIYRESSFSNHFSLEDFSEEDTKEIIRLFAELGLKHNIRLINFSGSVSAVA